MRHVSRWIPVCAAVGALLACASSFATPAFARKTKLPCTQCHFGGSNRLTKFGREFLYRGYQTKDATAPKDLSQLNLLDYVTIGAETGYTADSKADPSTSFSNEYHLIAGGPIREGFSFFVNNVLSGGETQEGYLQYTTTPAGPQYFYGRFGRVIPTVLKSLGFDPSLSASQVRSFTDTVFADPADTTGNTFTPDNGITGAVAGFHSNRGLSIEGGFLNGPAGDDNATNSKGVYGSVEQVLDKEGSTLAGYAYSGTFPVAGPPAYDDHFARYAGVGVFARKNLIATGVYAWGHDERADGTCRTPHEWSIELGYSPKKDITPFLRFEDGDAGVGASHFKNSILGLSLRLSTIGRLVLEGAQNYQAGSTSRSFSVLLHWLF